MIIEWSPLHFSNLVFHGVPRGPAIFTRDPVVILPRVPRFPGCFFVPTSIPWLFPQDYKGLSSLMLQKIVINSNKLDCATSSITSIRQCNDIGHRWEFFCVYLQYNVFKLIMQHSMDMTYRNAGGGFLNCTIFFIMKCAFLIAFWRVRAAFIFLTYYQLEKSVQYNMCKILQ